MTRDEMRQAVFEYIDVDYNRKRRHSAIDYVSPFNFEQKKVASWSVQNYCQGSFYSEDIKTVGKADGSPLTLADLASHETIVFASKS